MPQKGEKVMYPLTSTFTISSDLIAQEMPGRYLWLYNEEMTLPKVFFCKPALWLYNLLTIL